MLDCVSRGSIDDFERLVALGVSFEGKIALIKYGGLFRGLKVKNAQDHGAIAAVLFSDPGDDGNITVAKGYKAYPGMLSAGAEKGDVQFHHAEY